MNEECLAELRQEYEAWLEACRLVDEQNYKLWEAYCERRSEAYFVYSGCPFCHGCCGAALSTTASRDASLQLSMSGSELHATFAT